MRLIDADKLLDVVEEIDWYHLNNNGEMVHGANSDDHQPWFKSDEIFEVIRNAPTFEAAPVVHGKWLWELADNGWADHICSVCGYTENTDIHVWLGWRYCPNCGARMDSYETES